MASIEWNVYQTARLGHGLNVLRLYQAMLEEATEEGDQETAEHLSTGLDDAMAAARAGGWDGEMDEEPHVFTLPMPGAFRFGFVWTAPTEDLPVFVASPVLLPWFDHK
ncbi:hypothetical protein [Caballeronia sp. SBC2]|uniref:hypothetical protein n=1 Tax=Caballeronia sp. SBC2 TaxID=2705547 RepID=UPI0013E1D48C|nr:hypothetical protein [Caballeronia sp. SBC2]QIE22584.1 hypothetical protein SBC2_05940 [Caballeronia sp. SBC2]